MSEGVLSTLHPSAIDRLSDLTERIFLSDLTTLEALGILAILEVTDQRVNAAAAPVLRLMPDVARPHKLTVR
ncbi:hypothetical protein C0J29_14520 [Mycobacterium paragordonae]|uniref:MarR family transcriptional regulator n=1 Tax=Mycobacterium paragordonae TaxID=1389713 RepID=A0ABQ1C3W0_9MYCO|nr:hypothetical protein [Mycobacterium paragordonae]AYE95839.1 hypothetical protein C0J29_14520 [Mycobacterium paragordonae]GFG79137.1 hypothetical protein MPRG_24130 [Mycobacterium paragordonae]